MFGALPCISRPTLKIFAANQVTTHAAARPTSMVSSTCHVGGGVADPSRIIMAKVLTGGMKLRATANVEFGSRADDRCEHPRRHEHEHHRRHQRLRFPHLVHGRTDGAEDGGEQEIGNEEEQDQIDNQNRIEQADHRERHERKQPDADVERQHQHADRHLSEDLPRHELERRHRREQHLDHAVRLLLHGLRQQRLAADHDAEDQQPGEHERQRSD